MTNYPFVLSGYTLFHKALCRDEKLLLFVFQKCDIYDEKNKQIIRKWFAYFTNVIEHHHHTEDQCLFPPLIKKDNNLKKMLQDLSLEHKSMFADLNYIKVCLANDILDIKKITALMIKVQNHIVKHADLEDKYVVDSIKRNLSPLEQKIIEWRMSITTNPIRLFKMISWMAYELSVNERQLFFRSFPFFIRWLDWLIWKKKYCHPFQKISDNNK